MNCPHCRVLNRDERKFCGSCGEVLGEPCGSCAFVNLPAERFCGGCGTVTAPTIDRRIAGAVLSQPTASSSEGSRVSQNELDAIFGSVS